MTVLGSPTNGGTGGKPPSTTDDAAAEELTRNVLVQVPATPGQLPPLRAVAADLAARADFDLDTVADLRLAVDEAASQLVAISAPDSQLTATFELDADRLTVTVTATTTAGATVSHSSFGWRVLTTLVDDAEVGSADASGDGSTHRLSIHLTKFRTPSEPWANAGGA